MIMKKEVVLVLVIGVILSIRSQAQFVHKPSIELGYVQHNNSLNVDEYLKFKYIYNNSDKLIGLNLKLVFPTEIEYLDFIVGSLIEKQNITRTHNVKNGITADYDKIHNGGGVYFGIAPKLKWKYFGLTSEFAIGILSYKEYTGIFNNAYEPYVDEYIRKASSGLGAISSVGIYLQVGKLRINPNFQSIFSGGDQSSFLFYGFNLPVSYQF